MQGLPANHGATDLVLVTKRRSPASFKLEKGRSVEDSSPESASTSIRLRASLRRFEPAEPWLSRPVRQPERIARRCRVAEHPQVGSGTGDDHVSLIDSKDAVRAWDSLTGPQKVEALERVIKSGVARATAAALAD